MPLEIIVRHVDDLVLDPETFELPYDYLDKLRAEEPVYFSRSLNAYVLTRYADCQRALNNPAIFSSNPPNSLGLMSCFSDNYRALYDALGAPAPMPTLVVTDGPVHHRYRQAVDNSFNPASVTKLEPEIAEIVDQLIDAFIDEGRTDIYQNFCMLLPVYVICNMLGLPKEIIPLLRRSADSQARLAGGSLETEETRIQLHKDQAEFNAYLLPLIHKIRAEPCDSLISRLICTPTNDGSFLTDAEICSIVTTLNVGGNETTTNGLGNMFWLCFRDPDLQQRLRSNRSLIERFVEETLRLETPVSAMPRWVVTDTRLGDTEIPAGSAVFLNFLGANHDPSKFECPHLVNLERIGARNHMAFGMGPHYCLGAVLSRAELKIAMNRILDRLENIKVDSETSIRHQHKIIVRGLISLPIVFHKAGQAQG
jgi:cytochrome P450